MKTSALTGGNCGGRKTHDFYRTPEHAVRALLDREDFTGIIWEPACGDGAISRVLSDVKRYEVISSDLIDRGYGVSPVDFLTSAPPENVHHIVTNPPYVHAQAFVEKALEVATGKVAMLLKLNFLASQKRYELFANTPLKAVYVFSRRLDFTDKGKGALEYAWYVWDHSHKGDPIIKWIDPQK